MLRTHDVVVADGTFRILLTPKRRVVAILDAPHTMLGPLHLAFQIDRGPFLAPDIPPQMLEQPSHVTAGLFDDIGHAVSHAAEGAFNAASKAATTIARPAFNVLKGAAAEGTNLLAHATPFLPDHTRRQLDAAAHVIMRARLGDVTAKQFIKTIASAARSGVEAARHVGDTLLDASRLVAKAVDAPVLLASHVPGIGNILHSLSPLERFQHMVSAVQRGDFRTLEQIVKQDLSMAQGAISLVPGIGTGVSAAIGAGLAALEGGSSLEIAIRTAYGAIPIPPGVRSITDSALDGALALASNPHALSDVAVQVARDRVPAGLARDVFDTLVHVVVKRVPLQKTGGALVDHFVRHYSPTFIGQHIEDALRGLHADPAMLRGAGRMVQPLHTFHA
jgi:hypothetical protein